MLCYLPNVCIPNYVAAPCLDFCPLFSIFAKIKAQIMKQTLLTLSLILTIFSAAVTAKDYIELNDGWRFQAGTVDNGQAPTLDDGAWERIVLPHSWNALDGQDGGGNYRRGDGWYRQRVMIPQSAKGQRVYLDIGAACMQTWVYVNGQQAGSHVGGAV